MDGGRGVARRRWAVVGRVNQSGEVTAGRERRTEAAVVVDVVVFTLASDEKTRGEEDGEEAMVWRMRWVEGVDGSSRWRVERE